MYRENFVVILAEYNLRVCLLLYTIHSFLNLRWFQFRICIYLLIYSYSINLVIQNVNPFLLWSIVTPSNLVLLHILYLWDSTYVLITLHYSLLLLFLNFHMSVQYSLLFLNFLDFHKLSLHILSSWAGWCPNEKKVLSVQIFDIDASCKVKYCQREDEELWAIEKLLNFIYRGLSNGALPLRSDTEHCPYYSSNYYLVKCFESVYLFWSLSVYPMTIYLQLYMQIYMDCDIFVYQ